MTTYLGFSGGRKGQLGRTSGSPLHRNKYLTDTPCTTLRRRGTLRGPTTTPGRGPRRGLLRDCKNTPGYPPSFKRVRILDPYQYEEDLLRTLNRVPVRTLYIDAPRINLVTGLSSPCFATERGPFVRHGVPLLRNVRTRGPNWSRQNVGRKRERN